jgi:lipopolysaccharide biosynthesis regulator YciM
MKNITLSADEHLIELARAEARARKTTLNALFRQWLAEIAQRDEARKKADEVINNLSKHLSFDRKFTRDEMNER